MANTKSNEDRTLSNTTKKDSVRDPLQNMRGGSEDVPRREAGANVQQGGDRGNRMSEGGRGDKK